MPKKRSSDGTGGDSAPRPAAWPPDESGDEAAAGDRAALIERSVRRAVHDLRQPIQAMRLFVHLLGTRLEREQDRALVTKLDAALENVDAGLRGLMTSIAVQDAAPAGDGESPPATKG